MLSVTLNYQGIEDARQAVLDLSWRMTDLRPLAERVAEILRVQNLALRTLGEDRYGVPFMELAPSTMKKRERQGRLGPPLAPDGGLSPIVSAFDVDITYHATDDILVRGHWDSLPWVGFHTDNGDFRGHLPVRDPAGLPAYAEDQIIDSFDEFVAGLLAQSY